MPGPIFHGRSIPWKQPSRIFSGSEADEAPPTTQNTDRMPLLYLTCSQSYFSTWPPQDIPTKVHNFPFPSTSTLVSTSKVSPFSCRLLRNGDWVYHRRSRFRAKSAHSEPDHEPSAQSSHEVSSSGSNPSNSLLSLLCPLLKLFSVSIYLCRGDSLTTLLLAKALLYAFFALF